MIRSALLLAFTATTLAAQSSFEGSITMSLTGDDGRKTEMSYLAKNGKLRVEMPGGRGAGIIDAAAKKMLIVMTAQKMYLEMDLAGAQAAATRGANPPKVVRTGKTETIAGYKCEHIEVTGDDGVMNDVCGASGIGTFAVPSMGRGGPPPSEAWQKGMGDMFPLKVQRAGKLVIEVTKIEKKSLDDALFSVPSDFTKFDMGMRRGGGH